MTHPCSPAVTYAERPRARRPATRLLARSLLLPVALSLLLPVALPLLPAAPAEAAIEGPAATPRGVWPLDGETRVVQGFAPPDERWGRGHRGVDLAGTPAQQVRAALEGEVAFVGRIAGRGVVVVSHGETRTTYEPVLAAVAKGHTVAAGELLGWLHPTGSHCAPGACLHWGWRRGEEYLDPLGIVGGGPVRLLPLWREAPVPGGWSVPAWVATGLAPLGLLPRPTHARGWAWR